MMTSVSSDMCLSGRMIPRGFAPIVSRHCHPEVMADQWFVRGLTLMGVVAYDA
jgi:hypothetical protein